MLRIASCFLVAMSLAACGDDAVKPGEIVVQWNHGPTGATCGSRSVTTVEARALKGEELVASGTGACAATATSGAINLPDLAPGSYKIEVEAMTAAGKGTYFGSLAKLSVSEGKTTESPDITLTQKPATIKVDWTLPGGGRCVTAGIAEIEISLYYNAQTSGTLVGTPEKVECDSTGFELTDLVPNPDVQLIAFGYDSGNKKVAKATTPFFTLTEGDELTKVLALEACPGDPPVCP